jgi:hypothetical protein
VPLRSVEAATRDDAIAAAREQFGPQARVVGVRRVRSGGVLGFFTTERYVAEVAPQPAGPPSVPAPSLTRATDRGPQSDFASPLASAAGARATAPARNGAAAWAAEAAGSAAPARKAPPVHVAAAGARVDDDRLSELAGLLTAPEPEPSTPTYARATFPRASVPRTGATSRVQDEDEIGSPLRDGDERAFAATSAEPSPFTAALARMVAGDRDVNKAVQEALDRPADARPRGDAERRSAWPEPLGTSVSSSSARQEETVEHHAVAPSAVTTPRVEMPTWAAQPEAATAPVSPREEAVADLLRGALAHGPSDEDLAGILRKVLAEASSHTPLPEPETTTSPVGVPADSVTQVVPEDVVVTAPAVEDEVELRVPEQVIEEFAAEAEVEIAELAPMLARTASDPVPMMMTLDATMVMPPLSLLPLLPSSRGRGRPPVPPATSRPVVPPAPAADSGTASSETSVEPSPPAPKEVATVAPVAVPARPAAARTRALATVTRLPVAPLMATPEIPELPDYVEDADVEDADVEHYAELAVVERVAPSGVTGPLTALGLPAALLGRTFADDLEVRGTYEALTRALALWLPEPPELPSGAGEVLFVVGPGIETLRAARSLAASLRLDPDRVQWATRGDLAGLAPEGSRMTTIDAAVDRRQDAAAAGTITIVAVDAPLRTDPYWVAQMMAIWTPVAVWAVVEATRKPEDLQPWIGALPRVDALVVQDTDLSADPAAVLRHVGAPVALLDGARATPHRWASLLCERLESTTV